MKAVYNEIDPAACNVLRELIAFRACVYCGFTGPVEMFAKTGARDDTTRNCCKPCRNKNAAVWARGRRLTPAYRARVLAAAAKMRAAERGTPYDLTTAWVRERMERGVCEATGIAFDLKTLRGWNTPSLDQISANGGYTKSNTRLVLFALNAACGSWGEEKLLEIIDALRKEKSSNG